MASPNKLSIDPEIAASPTHRLAWPIFRLLASLQVAVVLIVVLAAILAWATLMEADRGREYTQWFVYRSQWFAGLLGLLGVNVLAAALIRFPWKRQQTGFVITHAGILVLLVGSIQTFLRGIEGQLEFVEGQAIDNILLTHRSQLRLRGHGAENQPPTELSFSPGPVDWTDDQPLDFGLLDGVRVRVLKFYRHARNEMAWIVDQNKMGPPALHLELIGANGKSIGDTWCESSPFGVRMVPGMPPLRLQRARNESMVQEFLKPPTMPSGSKGVLSVHYQGKIRAIPVDDNLGKEVTIHDDGTSVKIVEYLANAISKGTEFESSGDEPINPMLRLEIQLPDTQTPTPEIAYAKNPFVNLALMRGRDSPVECWYHNSDCPAPDGAEFLASPSGAVFCRVAADGRYDDYGEVSEGAHIRISDDASVVINQYIPHARREVRFFPVELAAGETARPEAAVLVEFASQGVTRQAWLQRNGQQHQVQGIGDPNSPLIVAFEYDRLPLGFSLRLIDFERGLNPGRMGNASFKSKVHLVDRHSAVEKETVISMNEPLVHDIFTFYQSGFRELTDGRESSSLSVSYDPGRFLKYLGSAMICVGICMMYYLKRVFRT